MEKNELQEQLATLYLRLNGYFVSGFIAHAPIGGKQTNRTQVDALAVRFPHNSEPERGIAQSECLQASSDKADVLICEVKGGREALQFNDALKNSPDALKSVLRWIGAFDESEIEKLAPQILKLITPNPKTTSDQFAVIAAPRGFQLRCILFAPDRRAPRHNQARYICGDEMVSYVWRCLCEGGPRPECATRYDFGLWGPYKAIVQFFKAAHSKPTMEAVYDELVG